LIRRAGDALSQILVQVADINASIDVIAKGAGEQATNLQGVNMAVSELDKGTQQNAAVVEEAAAAAEALAHEADNLARLTEQFQLGNSKAAPAPVTRPAAPRSSPQSPWQGAKPARVPRPARAKVALAVAAENDWQDF
ncbi:hypothetical protein EGT07_29480, partial [Herbaspirillum sp. HC18]